MPCLFCKGNEKRKGLVEIDHSPEGRNMKRGSYVQLGRGASSQATNLER